MFGPGSGPIFLDGVQCNGTEEKLMDCFHASIGHHACGHLDIETQHDFDVAIMCKGTYNNYCICDQIWKN